MRQVLVCERIAGSKETAMKTRVLQQTGIFLTIWGTIGFSRRILHRFSKIACYFVSLNSGLNFSILISTYLASITLSGSHHIMKSADCETNSIHVYLSSISAETITYYLIPNILSLFSSHQTDTFLLQTSMSVLFHDSFFSVVTLCISNFGRTCLFFPQSLKWSH